MKNRQGFVSNSSSSSFCIFGAAIELCFNLDYYIGLGEEKFKLIRKELPEFKEKLADIDNLDLSEEDIDEINDYLMDDPEWFLSKVFPELEIHWAGDYDTSIYLGRSWYKIKNTETGAQFKEKIRKDIKKICGPDIKCTTHIKSFWS